MLAAMSGQMGLPLEADAAKEAARWGSKASPASVGELVQASHQCLQAKLPAMWIEGEISGLRRPSSGHLYFTLKDDKAQIPAAMWRSAASKLRCNLKDGLKVRVYGRVGIYSAQGKYQLYAERIEAAGEGDKMAELMALKQKLSAEGLFDAERKRPIPGWPRNVGVITSSTGAAFHDICKVIEGRCPTRILLCHALVQGAQAPASLVSALERMGRRQDLDVLIIGRGGGSMEDLWCFNDEALVRAIAACPIPVISAVGHEIDVTLADGAADRRAATPSHAGELAVPDMRARAQRLQQLGWQTQTLMARRLLDRRSDLDRLLHRLSRRGRALVEPQRRSLQSLEIRMRERAQRWIPARQARLACLERRLLELHPHAQLAAQRQRSAQLEHRLERALRISLEGANRRFSALLASLEAMSPLKVLGRGYAIAQAQDGAVVRDSASLARGQILQLRLAQGSASVEVRSTNAEEPA